MSNFTKFWINRHHKFTLSCLCFPTVFIPAASIFKFLIIYYNVLCFTGSSSERSRYTHRRRAKGVRLRKKIKSEHGIQFACKCGRSYRFHKGLKQHQKWECGKSPSFKCNRCSLVSHRKSNMMAHIRRGNCNSNWHELCCLWIVNYKSTRARSHRSINRRLK